MALVLGLLVSAGLYFAYLWPTVEPLDDDELAAASVGAQRADVGDLDAAADPSAGATPDRRT